MNKSKLMAGLCGLMMLVLTPLVSAQQLDFSLLDATPVGSWQVREEVVTDHKGRETVNVIKFSLIGKEERDGEPHYWLEMAAEAYKLKRGKRKQSGDRVLVKSLVAASALKSDPANIINNLQGFGKEIIMQNGKDDPVRLTGSGMMAQSMMKALGTKVNYSFEQLGKESVTVKAGTFDANKIKGIGNTSVKVLFKTMNIESDSTAWMSNKVPFALVKGEGTTTTNGKVSTHKVELLEFGSSGAQSEITGTPQELPDLKGMFGQ